MDGLGHQISEARLTSSEAVWTLFIVQLVSLFSLCSTQTQYLNIFYQITTKLSRAVFTIFFPEVAAMFACNEWLSAHQLFIEFCRSQGFLFADMGSFMLDPPDPRQRLSNRSIALLKV